MVPTHYYNVFVDVNCQIVAVVDVEWNVHIRDWTFLNNSNLKVYTIITEKCNIQTLFFSLYV